MPKGYWIARIDVTNPEPFKNYAAGASEAVKKHGGRYLARGGAHQALQSLGPPKSWDPHTGDGDTGSLSWGTWHPGVLCLGLSQLSPQGNPRAWL